MIAPLPINAATRSPSNDAGISTVARPLRLGFVGLGWIGLNRCKSLLQADPRSRVTLFDPDSQALARAQSCIPAAGAALSFQELLQHDLDGIVIATPTALHAEFCIAALKAGHAVFCQKPLGRNAAETQEIVTAARAADRLLRVDFSYRHVGGVSELRQRIQANELGRVYAARLVFHNAYGPDRAWYYDRALSGGGCILDLAIHLLDLLFWIFPKASLLRTSACIRAGGERWIRSSKRVEDYAHAQLELSNEVCASLACSWRLPLGCDAEIEAAFFGTAGGLQLRNISGSFYDFHVQHFRGTSCETIASPPENWGGRALLAWVRELEAGRQFRTDAQQYVHVAQALDQIYGAAEPDIARAQVRTDMGTGEAHE